LQSGRAPLREESAREFAPPLRPAVPENFPKREVASVPAVARTHDEFSGQEHRGLVVTPKAATDLTAQMRSAASAMNASLNLPPRHKTMADSPALAAETEPSVHVTIGRIEVRATSESKQAGRPRSASPVMSLEEYLHRRTQRGGQ